MANLKDKLYDFFVKSNGRVWYEYERYVRENMEEHETHRLKHLFVLAKLNWFYRVRKRNVPYLYPDVPMEPKKEKLFSEKQDKVDNSPIFEKKTSTELVDYLCQFDVISFDIFDTLLFRYVNCPSDLFVIISMEMDKDDFKEIRIDAEKQVRKTKENGEVTIDEIYEYMEKYYSIEKKWMDREIELEFKYCYSNTFILNVYNQIIESGKKVIITSDMYLGKEILNKLLECNGICNYDDIFISCDYGCNKKNGMLQKTISFYYPNQTIVHVGDTWNSDICASKKIGWGTYYYKRINSYNKFNRYDGYYSLTTSLYEAINNQKMHSNFDVSSTAIYNHGFIYGGILVCGYCEWLNRLAKNEQIDQFLFVARDADIICKVYNSFYREIDNSYVMTSRFALYQTSIRKHINEYMHDMLDKRTNLSPPKTILKVLSECGLEFLREYLPRYSIDENSFLVSSNVSNIKKVILENLEIIEENYKENHEAAVQYFSQKIKNNAKKICIVDIGWKGTTTKIISEIINEINPNIKVISAFLGTTPNPVVESKILRKEIFAYCYSICMNYELMQRGKGMFHVYIELMHTSPMPSLLNYHFTEDNQVQFKYESFWEINYEIARNIQMGIIDFAKVYNQFTQDKKELYIINAYDAIGPLKGIADNHNYFARLYKDFREKLISGYDVDDNKITVKTILKNRKFI